MPVGPSIGKDPLTAGSQAARYNSGVLLHNWYEDRFAPKVGVLADTYPMPSTTYQGDFTGRPAPIRPMLRTNDLGKEILFSQGSTLESTSTPSVTIARFEKKRQEWSEMRDPEHAGTLVSTKRAVDSHVARDLRENPPSISALNRSTNFTKSKLTDHEHLNLRN
mmetsp:Transcript_65994/g.76660  ORF Transcript_65994/g.76660 Transcript_65994/m.76660 type:complete len:164 (-) Transcript_65994:185-676(-)